MSTNTTTLKIGQYLKYQREKRGLSLNDFAKITTLDATFLHRVEKGVYKSVSFEAVEKIAAGLNMTLEDLLAKAKITPSSIALPKLEYYLKEMYQFPDEAIEDTKLFFSLLKKKYRVQIAGMKKQSEEYWGRVRAEKVKPK